MKHTLFLFLFGCFFFQLPFGAAQLTVQGLLHVQGEASVCVGADLHIETAEGSIENNGTLIAEGNITKEPTATYVATNTQGSRKLILQGTNPVQRITGDFTGMQSFYDLSLNKRQGMVELNSNIEVSHYFNLAQGKLRTDIDSGVQASDYQYELYINNPAPNALAGNILVHSSRSFVEGRLRRSVSGTGRYSFPVGITENNPFFVTFKQPAPLSDISATLERGISTPIGMNFSCPSTPSSTIDCVVGRWNVQATAANYNYDILFTPSPSLLQNCPDATAFFVSKNASFDCQLDGNANDGIFSSQTGGFGVFDLPTALPMVGLDCPAPSSPTVAPHGNNSVAINWNAIPGVEGYIFQLRLKGFDRWLVDLYTPRTRLFVTGPPHLEYEYRIKTVCTGGESDYTDVFEFNIRNEGNLNIASSRNANEIDLDITDFLSETNIFPNPVNDQLQVSYTPINKEATLTINHIHGQLMYEATLEETQSLHIINTEKWVHGFYILRIKEKGQPMVSQKVTKMSLR